MSTINDFELAALAAGFTIGFGFLTVWEAIKQTRRNRNRLRSAYIYMIWGEIVANICIVIIGWLFLHEKVGPTIPVLLFILISWVFQLQLLMQIIINRIALIAEHRSTVRNIKWGTAALVTAINISVFCIWIPSHLDPPASQTFVNINKIWDKIEKVLILIIDAGLNWYFLRTVKNRLVRQHGLTKYAPLVGFNAKLMILSIGMDGMLVGLMFLKNPVVYIQFHPVVYMVKLNIEMSMASLVVRLAQGKPQNDMDPEPFNSSTDPKSRSRLEHHNQSQTGQDLKSIELSSRSKKGDGTIKTVGLSRIDSDESLGGIECRTDLTVKVERINHKGSGSSTSSNEIAHSVFGDEIPLHKNSVQGKERQLMHFIF